jgi:hypothetical protein
VRLDQLADRHRSARRVVADVEDRLEPGDLPEQRLDAREQALVDDEEAAARVDEPVLELLGGPPAVESHADAARGRGAEQRDDPVGAVVGEDRDAIALREAVIARERVRGAPDARPNSPYVTRRSPCTRKSTSPRAAAAATLSRSERSRFLNVFIARPRTVSVTTSNGAPGAVRLRTTSS